MTMEEYLDKMTDEFFELTEAIRQLEIENLPRNKRIAKEKCAKFNHTKNTVMAKVRDKWCKYE